jgi:segregation and condensation protein A
MDSDAAHRDTGPPTGMGEDGDGQGTPLLALDGFTGPLDHLLTLARAQKIDLSGISLIALVEQLATALRQAPAKMPLGQKGDWVVMAAWLLQADAPAQQEAAAEADQIRRRLVALDDMCALAGWLERRPQLGHDVFARGRPEIRGNSAEAGQAIDGVEFLWASLVLFDDQAAPETTALYRPRPFDLYAVAEARDRILQRLAAAPDGGPLDQFLPDPPVMLVQTKATLSWVDEAAGVHVERVSVPGPNGVNLDAALVLPEGAAKAPPVVALHGCGGPFPSRDGQWAALLGKAGHIVFLPDSFGSRSLGSQCSKTEREVTPSGLRRQDAIDAAQWLVARPGTPAGGVALQATTRQSRWRRNGPQRIACSHHGPRRRRE